MRKFQFQTGEYYHIYNRGVEGREIFSDQKDYLRFLRSMREFNNSEAAGGMYANYLKNKAIERQRGLTSNLNFKLEVKPLPLVEFIGYCLNQNHFHFIVSSSMENGVVKFMQKLGTAYTMFFNQKHSRSGSLFQGTYKAVHVNDYGYLLKLLVYVNCNHEIHNLGKAENWPWASYLDSVGLRRGNLCNMNVVREEFGELKNFKSFCHEIIPEIKENKALSKYLLE